MLSKCLKYRVQTKHSRYGVNHIQTHLHTAVGVVSLGLGQSRHTVVTIPQDLYPATVILLHMEKEKRKLCIGTKIDLTITSAAAAPEASRASEINQ